MEATIILVGLMPIMFALGGVAVYVVMTQQKILALACTPRHTATFYNVADKDAGIIIKQREAAGYRLDPPEMKRNRFSGNFDFTMTLAV